MELDALNSNCSELYELRAVNMPADELVAWGDVLYPACSFMGRLYYWISVIEDWIIYLFTLGSISQSTPFRLEVIETVAKMSQQFQQLFPELQEHHEEFEMFCASDDDPDVIE